MKTIEDLKKLIPTIVEQIKSTDHEIGECYPEQDEDGWGMCCDYTDNYFSYEEDGWMIEISYRCCGEWDCDSGDYWTPPSCDLRKAWGEVTEITAYHYDDDTDEESEFTKDDCSELWSAIDKVLEKIS